VKNAVFWDIETQFVPHRRYIISPLQSPAGYWYVRFEVFTAGTVKNAVSGIKPSSYHTDILLLRYGVQPVNAMKDLRFSQRGLWRMPFGICHCVALIRTDVSEECIASIIRLTRNGELGTMLAVTCRLFSPGAGDDTFLGNVGSYKCHTASHPRGRHSSIQVYFYTPYWYVGMRSSYRIVIDNIKKWKEHILVLVMDWRITVHCIVKGEMRKYGLVLSGLGYLPVTYLYEHGFETSASIKDGAIDSLVNCQLLKNDTSA
jgi:hypothetical protein